MLRVSGFTMLVAIATMIPVGADGGGRERRLYRAAPVCPVPVCPSPPSVPGPSCPGCGPTLSAIGPQSGGASPQRSALATAGTTCPRWYMGDFGGIDVFAAEYYPDCPATTAEDRLLFGDYDPPRDCDEVGDHMCVDGDVSSRSTAPLMRIPIPANGDLANVRRTDPKWAQNETLLQMKLVRLDHDGDAKTPEKVVRTYVFAVDPTFGRAANGGRFPKAKLTTVALEVVGGNPAGLDPATNVVKVSDQEYRFRVGTVTYPAILEAAK